MMHVCMFNIHEHIIVTIWSLPLSIKLADTWESEPTQGMSRTSKRMVNNKRICRCNKKEPPRGRCTRASSRTACVGPSRQEPTSRWSWAPPWCCASPPPPPPCSGHLGRTRVRQGELRRLHSSWRCAQQSQTPTEIYKKIDDVHLLLNIKIVFKPCIQEGTVKLEVWGRRSNQMEDWARRIDLLFFIIPLLLLSVARRIFLLSILFFAGLRRLLFFSRERHGC